MILIIFATLLSRISGTSPLSLLNAQLMEEIIPPLIISPLFINIANQWTKFVHQWETIDNILPTSGHHPTLQFKLNFICLFYVISKLGCTLGTMLLVLWRCFECLQLKSWIDYLEAFYFVQYQDVLEVASFPGWLCGILVLAEVIRSLQLTSISLFITSLATILTTRLKTFNDNIEDNKSKLMPNKYWREMREAHNNLAYLTHLLDDLISPLLFTTFILETLNIIVKIYNTTNDFLDPLYFSLMVVGCGRVVVVSLVTQLSVSAVHEESKRPLQAFNMVPAVCYTQEVQRLYEQVASETVALTGCHFFNVTRSVIMTVVSTIVTYEVVLIQFGSYQPLHHGQGTNSSAPLYCQNYWFNPVSNISST